MSEKALSIMVLLLDKDDRKGKSYSEEISFPTSLNLLILLFLFQNIFLGTIGENPAILYGLFIIDFIIISTVWQFKLVFLNFLTGFRKDKENNVS
jgi:hypothetical protein